MLQLMPAENTAEQPNHAVLGVTLNKASDYRTNGHYRTLTPVR